MTANALKPASCAGMTLTALVTGSGVFSATGASELVPGGAGIDTIAGGEGTDVCIGRAGMDVFLTCETQIQ